MNKEINRILGKVSGKARTIIRTKRYYSKSALINHFKTHILCHLEGTMAAFFHCSTTHLEKLNQVQNRFIEKIEVSEDDALSKHNLFPLQARRDIAALGIIHKVTIGIADPEIAEMFPPGAVRSSYPTRLLKSRHNKQISDICDGRQSRILQNSIFGMARVYNRLPQDTVDAKSIRIFQSRLIQMARDEKPLNAYMFSSRSR